MITFNNVSFAYEDAEPSIKDFNLNIARGEVVCLTGASGCGKTTLTRLISGLIPHFFQGTLRGDVLVETRDVTKTDIYTWSEHIGSVFQNPRAQFFCLNTTSELAFELENYAVPPDEMERRIEDGLVRYKLEHLMGRDIFELSGGEKQLIACTAVSICEHEVIVLDEPSSNLDFTTLTRLAEMIASWKAEGKTIVIAEHRLHYLMSLVDRFVIMEQGTIKSTYTQAAFSALTNADLVREGLRATTLTTLTPKQHADAVREATALHLSHFNHQYHKKGPYALNIRDQRIQQGEVTAIVGHNGAGKSTFARCLTGLERKFDGKVHWQDKTWSSKDLSQHVYMVFQDVNAQLFTESVAEEIRLSQRDITEEGIHDIASSLDIHDTYLERHPLSLSGGEMQRLAIASAIAADREILIFDEPTSGLDGAHMREVAQLLSQLSQQGHTILVISHDYELVLACADNILHLEHGEVEAYYRLHEETLPELQTFFNLPTT